ncbi:unnamed protein product [Lupinus luteus]|uniref:Legume lectin domain-containing protein n=1 Tax=Lupinus luteus TaxID=3873 RepID=A0AAV1WYZ4_LUPLU
MGPRWSLLITAITILLLFPPATSQPKTRKQNSRTLFNESYVFGPFNDSYTYGSLTGIFDVISEAAMHLNALQITPDSAGNISLVNKSGRVFLKKPFKLWDDENGDFNGKLASFNTSFLFNFYRLNNATPGEGMAFVIAPSSAIPYNSYGQYLGLTNSTTDGKESNKFVAIELDNTKQDFDLDNNHIGLDINSIRSNVSVPLSKFGFELSPNGATQDWVIWVEYDGERKEIHVYMAKQPDRNAPIVEKPTKPVLSSSLDLKSLVNQKSYFGFAASTGVNYELHCVLRWNISIMSFPEDKSQFSNALKIGLIIGLPLIAIAIAGPKMQAVVQIISGSVPVPHIPTPKPSFVWPAMDFASILGDFTVTTITNSQFNTRSSSMQLESFDVSSKA